MFNCALPLAIILLNTSCPSGLNKRAVKLSAAATVNFIFRLSDTGFGKMMMLLAGRGPGTGEGKVLTTFLVPASIHNWGSMVRLSAANPGLTVKFCPLAVWFTTMMVSLVALLNSIGTGI